MGGGRGRRRDADGIDRSRIVDAAAPLSVFMHTNRAVRNATREFTLSKGWWADTHDLRPLQRKYQRSEFPCAPHCKGMGVHMKFALHQGFKYQWLFSKATNEPEPWLLADTDVVVQCSAQEMRERFASFRSPLVIGAEFKWFPKRDYARNPWPPVPSGLRYPNSGLLMGSRAGFAQLRAAFDTMGRYPCCHTHYNGSVSARCHIDDQHCLQSALQQRDTPPVAYALDGTASLFLNLFGVKKEELVQRDGRCVYTPTNVAPCVLHSNGKLGKLMMGAVLKCAPASAWVAPVGNVGDSTH